MASERIGNANPQLALQSLDRLQRVAKATGMNLDAAFQEKITQIEMDVLAQSAVFAHAVQQAQSEMDIGAGSSFMKIVATENVQKIADLMFEAAGEYAADEKPIQTDEGPVDVSVLWREVRRITIYAGSSEIQRNITAKRVLGLP